MHKLLNRAVNFYRCAFSLHYPPLASDSFSSFSHWLHFFFSSPPPPNLFSFLSCCFPTERVVVTPLLWLASRLQTLWLRAGVGGLHHCLWGEATGMDWKWGEKSRARERLMKERKRSEQGKDDGDIAWGSGEEVDRELGWGRSCTFLFTWKYGRGRWERRSEIWRECIQWTAGGREAQQS